MGLIFAETHEQTELTSEWKDWQTNERTDRRTNQRMAPKQSIRIRRPSFRFIFGSETLGRVGPSAVASDVVALAYPALKLRGLTPCVGLRR